MDRWENLSFLLFFGGLHDLLTFLPFLGGSTELGTRRIKRYEGQIDGLVV